MKGTLKKSELVVNNNLVATRRSRGKEVKVPVKNQVEQEEVFMEENFKPEFTQQLKDVKVINYLCLLIFENIRIKLLWIS